MGDEHQEELDDDEFQKKLAEDLLRSVKAGATTNASDWVNRLHRVCARFSSDLQSVTLKCRDKSYRPLKVLDESCGGLAILLEDVEGLRAGDAAELVYRDITLSTLVRNIRAVGIGQHRVGLEWKVPQTYP